MNTRAIELLSEMKRIFGGSFGSSLLDEAPRGPNLRARMGRGGKGGGGRGKPPGGELPGKGFRSSEKQRAPKKDKGGKKATQRGERGKVLGKGPAFQRAREPEPEVKPTADEIAKKAKEIFKNDRRPETGNELRVPGRGEDDILHINRVFGAEHLHPVRDREKIKRLKRRAGNMGWKRSLKWARESPQNDREREDSDKAARKRSGTTRRNPFKRATHLGPTEVEGFGHRHHDQTGCWHCSCPKNIYANGCDCIANGMKRGGANCPDAGTVKHITFDPGYKRAYNDAYHKWRKNHEYGKKADAALRSGDLKARKRVRDEHQNPSERIRMDRSGAMHPERIKFKRRFR